MRNTVKMKVLAMGLVLYYVSAGAILVQNDPLHQSTQYQQSIQILTKIEVVVSFKPLR